MPQQRPGTKLKSGGDLPTADVAPHQWTHALSRTSTAYDRGTGSGL